ncbi:MAG: O-antigen ligase family protein [Aerococcus sp.]|nr:O-antigen ligase family protein [Aerococcus sp.]
MIIYLLALVTSVFLGSEFLAISTPVFQITIYRILAIVVIPSLLFLVWQNNRAVAIDRRKYSLVFVGSLAFWWLWGFASVLWSIDTVGWLRGMFLLTLGVSSVFALFFAVRRMAVWDILLKGIWLMMTLLALLGGFEVLTNHYFFADMSVLDKYGTFASDPSTRVPVTVFSNQNDYATMLLAYVATNVVLFIKTSNVLKRLFFVAMTVIATLLIYQTHSRLSLLVLILFVGLFSAFHFRLHLTKAQLGLAVAGIGGLAILLVMFKPGPLGKLDQLLLTNPNQDISGDIARINMGRIALNFVGETFGLGVGAGNTQTWMELFSQLPINHVYNLHNWWLEILAGYGVFVFIAYVAGYLLSIYRLFQIRRHLNQREYHITNALLAFMIIYIFASITSANNMLIEWHWVFFGMIISYISIMEDRFLKEELEA